PHLRLVSQNRLGHLLREQRDPRPNISRRPPAEQRAPLRGGKRRREQPSLPREMAIRRRPRHARRVRRLLHRRRPPAAQQLPGCRDERVTRPRLLQHPPGRRLLPWNSHPVTVSASHKSRTTIQKAPKEPPMGPQRISYVPVEQMDDAMRAEMERCQREGTP